MCNRNLFFYHTTVTAFGRRTIISESPSWNLHSRWCLHVTLYIRHPTHFAGQQLNVIIKSTENRKRKNSHNNALNDFSQLFFPGQLTHCSKPNAIANIIRIKVKLADVVIVLLIQRKKPSKYQEISDCIL